MQTTGRPDGSEQALALRCMHDAQLWHAILWATGGALDRNLQMLLSVYAI
jgi:hypothetical protein